MKLFIWNDADNASDNYHSGGGVVVIADDLARAREILKPATAENGRCEALSAPPDLVRECEGPECVFVHPNAGCC
jgi:hypothetical protein